MPQTLGNFRGQSDIFYRISSAASWLLRSEMQYHSGLRYLYIYILSFIPVYETEKIEVGFIARIKAIQ